MSKEEIEKLADEIAEKANECCNRSDGYEEEIRSFALKTLEKAVSLSQWISFRDQEPPKGQPILITDGKVRVVSFWTRKHDRGRICVYRGSIPASPDDSPPQELVLSVPLFDYTWEGYGFGLDEQIDWEWNFKDHEITHWMPLLELPGKEKG